MKQVKITVLKKAFHEDLAERYASPGLVPCPHVEEGMVFICKNGWQKPKGLCDNAWKSMMEYVFALSHGAENFYDGELKNKKAFIASISCCRSASIVIMQSLNSAAVCIPASRAY